MYYLISGFLLCTIVDLFTILCIGIVVCLVFSFVPLDIVRSSVYTLGLVSILSV